MLTKFKSATSLPLLALTACTAFAEVKRPNILWLVSEDNSDTWLGCYGNKYANTPNLDNLAKEGFLYTNAFASAPVCAASRSTWITGINAISMGTHNMRSRYPIPHDKISYYPDVLRQNGYFCGNFTKTDYNIAGRKDSDCWDEAKSLDWERLKHKQPFFQVINCGLSHESQAKRHLDKVKHSTKDIKLAAYHPDIPIVRKNYARYYDCVENMDKFIGDKLAELDAAGLADDTIVIYCSDHGGVLPRSKRFLFESGIHAPLIIRIPEKFKNLWPADKVNSKIDRLVSFVDMPKTWISLAGGTPPANMQGTIFLGDKTEPEKEYHFAFRGRMDERIDNQRAIRDKRFIYIRNYMPYVPWGQKLEYMWEMPMTQEWDNYNKARKTNAITGRFFTVKNSDELYDVTKDPDNVNNLIASPEYAPVIKKMRKALNQWQERIYDAGLMPESDINRRAKKNNMTVYELVRNNDLYNVKEYLKISDMAIEKNPDNINELLQALKSDDSAIRYWGIVGCFLLADEPEVTKEAITPLLADDSHEVRAMAAWLLIKKGDKEAGFNCLESMIKNRSYAILSVLNVLDWMQTDISSMLPAILELKINNMNVRKMQRTLLSKYNVEIPKNLEKVHHTPKKWKKKTKKSK